MLLRRCDINRFEEITKNKYIACYGIGGEFELIIQNYSEHKWVDRIHFLLDGNQKLQGKKKKIKDKEFIIESIDSLKDYDLSNVVIMPTCASFCDVIEMLNQLDWLNEVECYVFHCMYNMGAGGIKSIRQTRKLLIPSTIHYCWFGGNPIPDIYKRYIESWNKYCPDYNIIEWNEGNCNIDETAFTSEAYKVGKYGFVPDYFRLKIIYENGGIYLDTDVELVKSIDDLRYNEAFCGIEFPGRVALGLGFGAVKGYKLIGELMEYYTQAHFINNDGSINYTPSPVIQSKMLRSKGLKNGTAIRNISGLTVYPTDVLSPKNPYTGEIRITDNTYAVHHFDGTWLTNDMKNERQIRLEKANEILSLTKMV